VLVAAAVCPHPPLLVPEVAGAAARETDDLRAACRAAVDTLLGNDVVVVGAAPETRPYETGLPLALAIGAWLLPGARLHGIRHDASPAEAAALGATLARNDVALLVMGDGSARRDAKAPGYVDPRAEPYDAAVARALRDADPAALLALDPADDAALLVAGRAAWQVLAGAAGTPGTPGTPGTSGTSGTAGTPGTAAAPGTARYRGEVTYDRAPYGVGYLVATWSRA
jgi:uracil-DNA glycosylase